MGNTLILGEKHKQYNKNIYLEIKKKITSLQNLAKLKDSKSDII